MRGEGRHLPTLRQIKASVSRSRGCEVATAVDSRDLGPSIISRFRHFGSADKPEIAKAYEQIVSDVLESFNRCAGHALNGVWPDKA